MNIFSQTVNRIKNQFTITRMVQTRGTQSWSMLNSTGTDYSGKVNADANSIVMSCLDYIERVFSEAPLMLEEYLPDRQEWAPKFKDDFLDLLKRPNDFYDGTTLFRAMLSDRILTGTGYWIKVRSSSGRVVQLWWAPSSLMTPNSDSKNDSVFIKDYTYNVNGKPITLGLDDVIRFPIGMDPSNPRIGLSPMKSLWREIYTDDEAANMTASLLKNMGVPGIIISPKGGTISQESAIAIKEQYMEKYTGDRRGEPLVLEGETSIESFGFSPEQMQLRSLRGIPEERISARLGVSSAVVGLGAGLATTKVGATLREYREHDVETTIVPLWREIAGQLTQQLLREFRSLDNWRVNFNLMEVRVLQEDELKRAGRVTNLVTQGLIKVSEGRRQLGYPVLDEHEIYLRPLNLQQVPAGAPVALPSVSISNQLALRRDLERAEAIYQGVLTDLLGSPDEQDVQGLVRAAFLSAAESTAETLGRTVTADIKDQMIDAASWIKEPLDPRLVNKQAQLLAVSLLGGGNE